MKRNSIIFTAFLALLYISLSSDIDGPAHHGHGNVTGAPYGTIGSCNTGGCHGANNQLTIVQLQITDTSTLLPVTIYNALQTYEITITGDATAVTTALPGFGFQVSAVLGNLTQAGTFVIPDTSGSKIHTYPCGSTTIVEHNTRLAAITAGVNKYSIKFLWTAPSSSDSVTFYTMLNAVNGDDAITGDHPNAAPRVTIYENPASAVVNEVPVVNNTYNVFSVYPNPASGNFTISYFLMSDESVSLAVYDMTGRKVALLTDNEIQGSGIHQYHPVINTPGLYFIRFVSGSSSGTYRFVKQ